MTIKISHHDPSGVSHATRSGESESALTTLVHTIKVFPLMVSDCLLKQGFTLDEWMVLNAIEHNNGSSMSEISATSGCLGASLTRTVDKLVTNSLVYREVSPTDRRKVEVFLSNLGRDTHRNITEHLQPLETAVDELIEDSGIEHSSLLQLMKNLQNVNLGVAVDAR